MYMYITCKRVSGTAVIVHIPDHYYEGHNVINIKSYMSHVYFKLHLEPLMGGQPLMGEQPHSIKHIMSCYYIQVPPVCNVHCTVYYLLLFYLVPG